VSSSRTSASGAGRISAGAGSQTAIDVTMPQMGVSVAEGTVVAWRVQVGDTIAADQTICDRSTDKIDTEVPSPASGVVTEILVEPETTVPVGAVLARIAAGDGGAAAVPEPPAPQPDALTHDAPAAPSHDAPAAPSHDAPAAPSHDAPAAPTHDAPESGGSNGDGLEAPEPNGSRRYSPVVRRIAAEHGVDLSQISGSGRGGRVRKQDVLAFLESGAPAAPLHIESPYRPESAPAPTGQLSRMRRQIGEHMKRSLQTAAHCTTWIEADMGGVEAARARLGVTALAFVARAAIDSLRAYPALNAWLQDGRYQQPAGVNLGIAVSLGEDGLLVPVIHDAHELSVEGLAGKIKDLARRARGRELTPDDVRDGTFTITNPGQYGSIMATPIINQPQVAILDLEAIVKRPVVLTDARGTDSIAIRPMTILGLSWDHRALDGAVAAQFLADLKQRLEAVVQ
jgi:pyruvate/2-oxoglutarate dehydrogenase complex dihydrolipoamide acyltransferase (E2) component